MALVPPAHGSILAGRFKFQKLIGQGSFGSIYVGDDLQTGDLVAIKIENSHRCQLLDHEYRIYRYLHRNGIAAGIPQVLHYSQEPNINTLVVNLLGKSLESLFKECKGRLSLKTVLMLADQLISRMEFMHSNHILHRDIKPENFLIGRHGPDRGTVFAIDFGLSKKYRDSQTRQHIPLVEGKTLIGTARYASISTHQGLEQSRRDDLESIGYMLLYFLKGKLPWQGLVLDPSEGEDPDNSKHFALIMRTKLNTSMEDLCRDTIPEFGTFIMYCRALAFEEQPDYATLRKLFRLAYARLEYPEDGLFDWDPKPHPSSAAPSPTLSMGVHRTASTVPQAAPAPSPTVNNSNVTPAAAASPNRVLRPAKSMMAEPSPSASRARVPERASQVDAASVERLAAARRRPSLQQRGNQHNNGVSVPDQQLLFSPVVSHGSNMVKRDEEPARGRKLSFAEEGPTAASAQLQATATAASPPHYATRRARSPTGSSQDLNRIGGLPSPLETTGRSNQTNPGSGHSRRDSTGSQIWQVPGMHKSFAPVGPLAENPSQGHLVWAHPMLSVICSFLPSRDLVHVIATLSLKSLAAVVRELESPNRRIRLSIPNELHAALTRVVSPRPHTSPAVPLAVQSPPSAYSERLRLSGGTSAGGFSPLNRTSSSARHADDAQDGHAPVTFPPLKSGDQPHSRRNSGAGLQCPVPNLALGPGMSGERQRRQSISGSASSPSPVPAPLARRPSANSPSPPGTAESGSGLLPSLVRATSGKDSFTSASPGGANRSARQ